MNVIKCNISEIKSNFYITQSQKLTIIFNESISKNLNIIIKCINNANIDIDIIFLSNNCNSDINVKVFVDYNIVLNIVIRLHIPQYKKDINTYLNIENLIINKYAHVNLTPVLLVESQYVNVSHSIKNIYLDKEQYNYLYTRGFNKKNVKKILINNFL